MQCLDDSDDSIRLRALDLLLTTSSHFLSSALSSWDDPGARGNPGITFSVDVTKLTNHVSLHLSLVPVDVVLGVDPVNLDLTLLLVPVGGSSVSPSCSS